MSTNMETAIEFANKVRVELSHLTTEQIADLTDGLEADIASSLDDGADIGSAEKYATDLLAAAGMSKDIDVVPNVVDVFIKKVLRWSLSISDLAPAWWVFRAWVATQLTGFALFHEETGSPAFYEWNNRPFLGFVLFVVLVVLSICVGRMNIGKLKSVVLLSHVVLGVGATLIMFGSPRTHDWFMYSSGSQFPTTTVQGFTPNCLTHEVPNASGLLVRDAQVIIDSAQLDYFFFNPEYGTLNVVPQESVVVNQDPAPGTLLCTNQQVKLWVEWIPHIDPLTKTTVLPEDSEATTTTTVKLKATTTTSP
ncbi:MAG: hypothetical protein NTZ62_00605 [Actinobacteria bacterium]|nr:hypothetical protein [Actinomycetota bacterium]